MNKIEEDGIVIEETNHKNINGYDFAIQKGYFNVISTDKNVNKVYFYGYFTMFEESPIFYMTARLEQDAVELSVDVMDNMMESFREWRATDVK